MGINTNTLISSEVTCQANIVMFKPLSHFKGIYENTVNLGVTAELQPKNFILSLQNTQR